MQLLELNRSHESIRHLSEREADFLDRNGFLLLQNVLKPRELAELRNRSALLLEQEGDASMLPNPTQLQLWANRRDLRWSGRIGASAYRAVSRLVRYAGSKWLFRFFPHTKLDLRARFGSPMFNSEPGRGYRASEDSHLEAVQANFWAILSAAAFTERGTGRLCNLIDKDPAFDICFLHPRVLAAAEYLLGSNLKVSSINYREPKAGGGQQPLHVDWEQPTTAGEYYACNCLWLLDDFTKDNGGTRVVPGSHRWAKMPEDEVADPMLPHPQEQIIEAPAGSLLILNSHVWHGGTRNLTGRRRRAIQTYCVRREFPQQLNQRQYLSAATVERLSPRARYLLDV